MHRRLFKIVSVLWFIVGVALTGVWVRNDLPDSGQSGQREQPTLRGLFIWTTLLAVVLGMVAWLDHSWIGK
jgi:hypothetical protein